MKKNLLSVVLLISIVLILLARFHAAMIRYFDPDEFAHLHWAWLIAQGKLPYRDFFFYATPLYQWFLWPLFQLPPSDRVLLLARLWQFGLYCLFLFLLYRISLHVTRLVTVGLLTILIFVTFPMTFDKTIDIRPDVLMTVLYFFAIERILYWPVLTGKRALTIGLLLGTSFLIFFKIIYALPAALLYVVLSPVEKKLTYFFTGLVLPLMIFLVYLLANNLFSLAWEAFAYTQFVVNAGKETFSLLATLSPWPLVYVPAGGVSLPWLVNIGVWIAALGGLLVVWKQTKPFAAFAACFACSAFIFLIFFPAPYVQYFIPLSILASLLSATTVSHVLRKMPVFQFPIIVIIIIIFITSFFLQYRERVTPASNNAEQLQVIRDVLTISKPSDTFYDMVGSYVFRPDGYFICCHPYAEFIDKLKTKPPSLSQSLISNNTRFLILDRTGQSLWKPKQEDLDFLLANYVPSKYPKIYGILSPSWE